MKQSKHKRKTPVIRDTLCPVWDYRTEYDIDYEDLGDHGIEFSVRTFYFSARIFLFFSTKIVRWKAAWMEIKLGANRQTWLFKHVTSQCLKNNVWRFAPSFKKIFENLRSRCIEARICLCLLGEFQRSADKNRRVLIWLYSHSSLIQISTRFVAIFIKIIWSIRFSTWMVNWIIMITPRLICLRFQNCWIKALF